MAVIQALNFSSAKVDAWMIFFASNCYDEIKFGYAIKDKDQQSFV